MSIIERYFIVSLFILIMLVSFLIRSYNYALGSLFAFSSFILTLLGIGISFYFSFSFTFHPGLNIVNAQTVKTTLNNQRTNNNMSKRSATLDTPHYSNY